MTVTDIVLRDLRTVDDCQKVVGLERTVWGYTDSLDIVPVPILIVTAKRGGILIGAFAPTGEMVGFVYSLAALKNGRATQWSHMLGVADAWRRAGLGRRLKLAQRDRTLDMGLDLIEWTFDPMQAANAHLNLSHLGVVVEDYAENIYGDSSSPLHRGTPTDRLIAQWWIRDPRVVARLSGGRPRPVTPRAISVNQLEVRGHWLACRDIDLSVQAPELLVHIPVGFSEMQAAEPAAARDWRSATREIFVTYFGRGYRAVDFFLDGEARRGAYLLAGPVRQAHEAKLS
ncbi:MAG: hypothetical protein HYS05_11580 [Acidobacteria bacterium]|nr:hypothetical protein [Acidobacteriota bacterium]